MSLQIGIVGLPNVGKSTLFNALVSGCLAEAANYPFCTIEPNVGVVEVPDERLKPLAETSKSAKIVPTVIEFVDIAGLVKNAHKGEGLGNQFLSHIRECDAIAMVVRFFDDKNVSHVDGKIDPKEDIKTIETELQLADINTVEKRLYAVEKELKANSKEAILMHSALQKVKDTLFAGKNAIETTLEDEELKNIKILSLLTMKPTIYIANCSEDQIINFEEHTRLPAGEAGIDLTDLHGSNNKRPKTNDLRPATCDKRPANFIPICAKIESEINELEGEEKAEYLKELGIEKSGLDALISEAYKTLGLITFFTSGEKETRAWTIQKGAKAPEAAGVIHTDFERGFIAAEIIGWLDLVNQGGWNAAKASGLVRTEGKNYIVNDGDVAIFKFNV